MNTSHSLCSKVILRGLQCTIKCIPLICMNHSARPGQHHSLTSKYICNITKALLQMNYAKQEPKYTKHKNT
uniref:Uncharacterized protein n=1 Tax=Anguilla anguilla TaxID=7936 RepID=A0A0E9QRL9_ANGAN